MSIQKKRVDSRFRNKIKTSIRIGGRRYFFGAAKGDTPASPLTCSPADADCFARHKSRACSQANANYPVEISVMNFEGASVKNHIFFALINQTSLLNFFVSLNSKCFVRPHFDQSFTHKFALHIFLMPHASRFFTLRVPIFVSRFTFRWPNPQLYR